MSFFTYFLSIFNLFDANGLVLFNVYWVCQTTIGLNILRGMIFIEPRKQCTLLLLLWCIIVFDTQAQTTNTDGLPLPSAEASQQLAAFQPLILFFIILILATLAFLYLLKRTLGEHTTTLQAANQKIEKFEQTLIIMEEERDKCKEDLNTKALEILNLNEKINYLLSEIKIFQKEKHTDTQQQNYIEKITHRLENIKSNENAWDIFMANFQEAHPTFIKKIQALNPNFSTVHLKHFICLKMNLSIKETGDLLNHSTNTVKQYRWRIKKMLQLNTSTSLKNFIHQL